MINCNKLKAALAEEGLSQARAAVKIGMSSNSFGRKINGHTEFTVSEIVRICKLLNIHDPIGIFLPDLSQKCNDDNTRDSA